jgi:hypothetical protein
MEENGTRQRQSKYNERPESRFPNNKYTTDVGLNKYLVVAATFATDGTLTDVASDFNAAGFAVNDQIIIWNSASNNGVRTITAVSSTVLTCDWPFKTEGPTTGVVVRNT